MADKTEETYGTFEKDGQTRTAYSQDAAVALRFNGWAEQKSSTKKSAASSGSSSSTS